MFLPFISLSRWGWLVNVSRSTGKVGTQCTPLHKRLSKLFYSGQQYMFYLVLRKLFQVLEGTERKPTWSEDVTLGKSSKLCLNMGVKGYASHLLLLRPEQPRLIHFWRIPICTVVFILLFLGCSYFIYVGRDYNAPGYLDDCFCTSFTFNNSSSSS